MYTKFNKDGIPCQWDKDTTFRVPNEWIKHSKRLKSQGIDTVEARRISCLNVYPEYVTNRESLVFFITSLNPEYDG